MKTTSILSILLVLTSITGFANRGDKTTLESDSPDAIIHKVVRHFFEKHNNFSTQKDAWGGYTMDITFEAMLFYDLHTGNDIYTKQVSDIMELRNRKPSDTVSYRSQPFCSYNYALYRATGNKDFVNPYVSETVRMMKEVKRTPEGAVQLRHKDKNYVLIDYVQEYCSRMARAGSLTGDTMFYKECADQYEIYREMLRNPETGLYSMGRGWLPDKTELSPGAWSRGHGWLMRGIVPALEAAPPQSTSYFRLQAVLEEMADALLKVQDENGMWHQLPHLPFDKSYPETSGTGMIAYNLAVAYKKGFLKDEKYRDAALLAASELNKYVTEDGAVLGACVGPGPLRSIENYLDNPAEPDDGHGPQAIIYGMLAEIILTKPTY
ncbi:MAG: glycoside hydrolase family 88 protein [Bacteroidales bacterium]|nr:glycoside hydrolase family 88 protein [Bacteroidales bacterium]